ncbi:hypothetical protein ACLB2K_068176 [Fragaria x ananassa]
MLSFINRPGFRPEKIPSFSSLPCSSPLCRHLDSPGCSSKSKTCLYQVSYGDGSFTFDDFSTETLTFRRSKIPKVALGCGHDNEGLFVGAVGINYRVSQAFTPKDNYQSDNNRSNYKRAAAAGCGFWRSIGKEKQIVATTWSDQCACSQAQLAAVLAVRKTLVFFGSHGRKKKTKHHHRYRYQHQNGSLSTSPRWFMHEYHLRGSEVLGNNWVLCSVFQKRRKPTSKKRGRTSALDNIGSCCHLPKPSNMFD